MIRIVLRAATPANVLIGPHQDKFCLVDLLYFGIVDSYYLERNTPPSRSCRYDMGKRLSVGVKNKGVWSVAAPSNASSENQRPSLSCRGVPSAK